MNENTTIAHYRILSPLGKGGMGEVYLAEDTRLKREVAIKVLPERLRNNPERLKRFRREAEAAASLKHPNIATIYALEEFDGDMFITMEHVAGASLKDRIPEGGMDLGDPNAVGRTQDRANTRFAPTFFDIFIPLADALSHAHS